MICFLGYCKKSQEFVGDLWILEKLPGKIRISMPSCNIFLGIRSTFWESSVGCCKNS